MKSIKFLIIENDNTQRDLLEYNIRMLGYSEVMSFECITSAYSWLQLNEKVDILICDLDLASTSLVFLKKISEKYNIGGVAFFSKVDIELRRSIARFVELLGIKYLGDLRASILKLSVKDIVHNYNLVRDNVLKDTDITKSNFQPSATDLQNAIEKNEFIAVYQPKYYLNSMKISGAEVLLRWDHPIHGLLTPDLFMHKLIENNLLDSVFVSIFRQGLELQSKFSEKNCNYSLAYNLDVLQLNSSKFVRKLIDIVKNSTIQPNLITFEITEKNFETNQKMVLKNLVRLRVLGFELAIDDFGSAYSSFSRLCDFPFTQIKLDKNFIRNICVDNKYKFSLISVISMASMMNMNLVVEGVESEEQFSLLRSLGCLEAQGFYFSKPLHKLDFINKIIASQADLDQRYLRSNIFSYKHSSILS